MFYLIDYVYMLMTFIKSLNIPMLIGNNIPGFLCKNSKLVENTPEFPQLKD